MAKGIYPSLSFHLITYCPYIIIVLTFILSIFNGVLCDKTIYLFITHFAHIDLVILRLLWDLYLLYLGINDAIFYHRCVWYFS
jgi:hypothetical protein